jgi:hypothetical protein
MTTETIDAKEQKRQSAAKNLRKDKESIGRRCSSNEMEKKKTADEM